MAILIETTEEGLLMQEENFVSKIDKYATFLDLVDTDVAAIKDDVPVLKYSITVSNISKTGTQSANAFKRNVRHGGEIGALPVAPVFPTPVPKAVPTGIEKRFRDMAQVIFKKPNCTEDILRDLGLLAPEGKEDTATVHPVFSLEITSSGQPLIIWKKGGFTGVEIHKSTDNINFTKLDKEFAPDTIDKSPLPAQGKSEVWYYKMIYLQKDEWIGVWSEVLSLAVIGH